MNSTKINLGLERITQLLEILGNPQEKLKIIHVAGTNGKGSVCAFISTILQHAGYKIGRFTSPFLREPRDSILVQNEMMNDSIWNNYREQLEEKIAQKKSWDFGIPSSFEILTSIAFLYFAEQTVDFAIIEVGMGGRLDATNAFSKALISIITSISEDHKEYLGDTVAKIASEKAGIFKGNNAIVIEQKFPEVIEVINQKAIQSKTPLKWIHPCSWKDERNQIAVYDDKFEFYLNMLGDFQLENSALAIACIFELKALGFAFHDEKICEGIRNTKWNGRMEWIIVNETKILVDGAHNKGGTKELRRYINKIVGWNKLNNVIFLYASSRKEEQLLEVLRELLKDHDTLIAIPFPTPESMPWIKCFPSKELERIGKVNFPTVDFQSADSIQQAFELIPKKTDSLIVLCGSLYLISEFYRNYIK